jgi:hypothetical protein
VPAASVADEPSARDERLFRPHEHPAPIGIPFVEDEAGPERRKVRKFDVRESRRSVAALTVCFAPTTGFAWSSSPAWVG